MQNVELGPADHHLVGTGPGSRVYFPPGGRSGCGPRSNNWSNGASNQPNGSKACATWRAASPTVSTTFLAGVQGHAELQRLDAVSARQSTEYIDAQIQGCRRAADIVTQLLNYSGYGRFEREPTALGPWLGALTKSLTPKGSMVAVEVEVAEDAVAAVDRKAIAQAIDGLVANAIESMTGRSGSVVVRLQHESLTGPRLMSGPYRAELPPGVYACIRRDRPGRRHHEPRKSASGFSIPITPANNLAAGWRLRGDPGCRARSGRRHRSRVAARPRFHRFALPADHGGRGGAAGHLFPRPYEPARVGCDLPSVCPCLGFG